MKGSLCNVSSRNSNFNSFLTISRMHLSEVNFFQFSKKFFMLSVGNLPTLLTDVLITLFNFRCMFFTCFLYLCFCPCPCCGFFLKGVFIEVVFLEVILIVLGLAENGAVILLVICTVMWCHIKLESFVTGF